MLGCGKKGSLSHVGKAFLMAKGTIECCQDIRRLSTISCEEGENIGSGLFGLGQ